MVYIDVAQGSGGGGLSTGAIVGIAVGGVLVILGIIACAIVAIVVSK